MRRVWVETRPCSSSFLPLGGCEQLEVRGHPSNSSTRLLGGALLASPLPTGLVPDDTNSEVAREEAHRPYQCDSAHLHTTRGASPFHSSWLVEKTNDKKSNSAISSGKNLRRQSLLLRGWAVFFTDAWGRILPTPPCSRFLGLGQTTSLLGAQGKGS